MALARDHGVRLTVPTAHGPDVVRLGAGPPSRSVERLLLDGAATVEVDGSLLSGLAAFTWLHPEGTTPGVGRLAELSRDAVRYGQQLRLRDQATLARRLYGYNCAPCSPAWRRRLPSPSAVAAYLRLAPGDTTRRLLDSHWSASTDSRWVRCSTAGSAPPRVLPFKLYVSPRPHTLPAALAAAIRVFAERGVPSFKVARTPSGVLRPDALVAYLESRDRVHELGAALNTSLAGLPAQGVPFTAELEPAGLLSWGADPVVGPPVSRRRQLADRLAAALIVAGHPQPGMREPWECALHRLVLDEVDIATWKPIPHPSDVEGRYVI